MADADCTPTKVCSKCKIAKGAKEFYASKRFKDGLRKECKACEKARANEWRNDNLDRARQSKRDWASENKEHVLAYSKAYHQANLDEVQAKARVRSNEFRKANPEIARERNQAYKIANIEKNRANAREWGRKNPERANARAATWAALNNARFRARVKAYAESHPEYARRSTIKRRARLAVANVGWANEFYIAEIYDLARLRSRMTGFAWCVDHVIPLRGKMVSGLHVQDNLAVIPARVNAKKSNKYQPE